MADLLHEFQHFIKDNNLFQKDNLLIIATSGGADSTALCHLCRLSGFRFLIAHCNFHLRGAESNRDEHFVVNLAQKLGVELKTTHFDTEKYAKENKVSIEVAARELRYGWFDQLVTEQKKAGESALLLTAHHLDDSIETLLMHFFQGTGVRGLQGIPMKNRYIVRPLLFARKDDILEFSKQQNSSFVVDSTNLTNEYTRNYFRNELIPGVEKIYPNVKDNLAQNLDRFADVARLYEDAVARAKKRLITQVGDEVHLPVNLLQNMPAYKTILFEIIRDYGFTANLLPEVLKLLQSESGKLVYSDTHRVIKNRNHLIIAPVNSLEITHLLIEENTKSVRNQLGKITVELIRREHLSRLSDDPNVALLDAAAVSFPLLVRSMRQGDYFYPLGMNKKKKLSRYLIDNKLSLLEKEKIQVVELDKKILWIVGRRIDHRFRVTDKTKVVLKLKFFPAKTES